MSTETIPATIIQADGQEKAIHLPADLHTRVRCLSEIVGGPIQSIPLSRGRHLVLNEDGKLLPHEVNVTATMLASCDEAIRIDDYIAGPAVLLNTEALC